MALSDSHPTGGALLNGPQNVITGSFVIVGGYLAVKHHWFSQALAWAGAPPASGAKQLTTPSSGLQDWQAALIAYTVLLVVGATGAAPIAEVLAAGIAVGAGIQGIGLLGQEYPGIFGGPVSAAAGNLPAAGSTTGQGQIVTRPPATRPAYPPGQYPPGGPQPI